MLKQRSNMFSMQILARFPQRNPPKIPAKHAKETPIGTNVIRKFPKLTLRTVTNKKLIPLRFERHSGEVLIPN